MALLDKDALLKKKDLRRALVDVDGDQVWMRQLSVAENARVGKLFPVGEGADEETLTLALLHRVAYALCNEDGTPMVEPEGVADLAAALMASSSKVATDLSAGFLLLNGATTKETLKEAVGNSDGITSDDSSSSSPKSSDTPAPTLSLSA